MRLEHTRRGVVACVFDTSDRVQHMFFRHLEGGANARWSGTVEELYVRMDGLVGKAMQHADGQSILVVLSDHGFCHFRRAVEPELVAASEWIPGAEGQPRGEWGATSKAWTGAAPAPTVSA